MADPHAIIAEFRIVTNYTVSGVTHQNHAYAFDAGQVAGAWFLDGRASVGMDLPWEDCAARLADMINYAMYAGVSWGESILQRRSGLVWEPVDTTTVSPTPNSGVVFSAPGAQQTYVFRDELLNKFKWVTMEANEAAPQHWETPTGGDSAMDAIIASFIGSGTPDAHDPYQWIASKYKQRIKQDAFVGVTVDLNRKTLRARGLK